MKKRIDKLALMPRNKRGNVKKKKKGNLQKLKNRVKL